MNPMQLEYFRQKLLRWRIELLQESNETLQHLQEESLSEPDIADRASLETDRALELRTRDRERKLISKIDEALRRIEEGVYGFCEETGEPIGIARLEARPIATPAPAAEPHGAISAAGVSAVSSLEALIALQEVGGPLERRRRAVGRANTILAALEGLKLDLLEGQLTPGAMQALTRAVREQRSLTDDPRLEGLLDEIETRAAVELAKLEGVTLAA